MSIRRKNILITPAKLRAQRANARLSRGPRTREGLRRSALNRRGLKLSFALEATGHNADARDLVRIWRDLLAKFWFIKPDLWRCPPESGSVLQLESRMEQLASAWWRKLRWIRMRASKEDLANADNWIEGELSSFLFEFQMGNQKADYWLRKEFGTDGRLRIGELRERLEDGLGAFREERQKAAAARNPKHKRDRSGPSITADLLGAPVALFSGARFTARRQAAPGEASGSADVKNQQSATRGPLGGGIGTPPFDPKAAER